MNRIRYALALALVLPIAAAHAQAPTTTPPPTGPGGTPPITPDQPAPGQRPRMPGGTDEGTLTGDTRGAEKEIQKLADDISAAWNSHDVRRFTSYFTDDATLGDPTGRLNTGRAEIERAFNEHHQARTGPMRESTSRLTVTRTRWVTPDIAFVDLSQRLTGVRAPNGTKMDHDYHVTSLVRREGGTWRVLEARPLLIMPRDGRPMGRMAPRGPRGGMQ